MEEEYMKINYLAQDRTHLANQRTLLAYWRTALNFFILGAFLLKFFPMISLIIISVLSIISGIFLFIYGTVKFFNYKEIINKR